MLRIHEVKGAWRGTVAQGYQNFCDRGLSSLLQDEKLTKEEILENWNMFVGSQATNYGEDLTKNHDELWYLLRTVHTAGCHGLSFTVLDGCYSCLIYSSCGPPKSKFLTSDWGQNYFSLTVYWKIVVAIVSVRLLSKHIKILVNRHTVWGYMLKHDFLAFSIKHKRKGKKMWKTPIFRSWGGSIWSNCCVF